MPLKTLLGACFLALCIGLSAAAEPLRLASALYPPYYDIRLPNDGVAVDLASTALHRAGYATVYREVNWSRALYDLEHDRYDVVVGAWPDPAREVYGQYSEPFLTNHIRFIRRKYDAIEYDQLSGLTPYVIAVVRNFTYDPAFDANTELQKYTVNHFESAARMLMAHRVDLIVEDELVAKYAFRHELADIAANLEFLPKALSEPEMHILVRRSHPQHQQIIDGFNAAMRAMRQDGTYAQIMQRHAND
jgi:polar amino acid transport system substrate-binding protein